MRYHPWPKTFPPQREKAEQGAEQRDPRYLAHSLVEMPNAEDQRLDQDSPAGAACDRLKLLLKVASKCEFLAKTCRERKRQPRQALKNSLRKNALRGIRPAAQNVSIHQAHPHRPEPRTQGNVLHHILRRCPPAADKIAQAHSTLVNAHPNVKYQKPFGNQHRHVARDDLAGRRSGRCHRVPLCGVLKETTGNGQP